ncbi:SLAIN motif-containing protein-like isoform X2 [Spea bombifrons]|uniref:SLAIN motif-containing protein-like isoform X2 n=1 Tax=Spea bombifrons TaxID=233779 RepID=UPI0023494055|nr:SLAIN motif-containing protein-like isoform X2 [Spea bombifrons]
MMVVPESTPGVQPDDINADTRVMETDTESDPGNDLKEVRKLQELVRRLEIQNQQLKIKSNPQSLQNDIGADPHLSTLHCTGVMNSMNIQAEKGDRDILTDIQTKLDQISSEKENIPSLRVDAQMQFEKVCSDPKPGSPADSHCDKDDSCFFSLDASSRAELEEALDKMSELNSSGDLENLDETALDEVEVLELGLGSEDDEDCWLYISPRKTASAEQKPDSPLKWCRQVLDHHSPETEAACRTLIGKLDQGYLSIHSALSSQSSVDSELSTSDDSISMGYKLQDLTDVQVMARMQEESLRQDYASSSASVSRRSSSASLHSLRRGTFSDQEFDTYSLEDEEDYECSLSYRSTHRYSPSPLSSPRCQSPSAAGDSSRFSTSRIRPPRRSIQNHVQDRVKYANCEDDLRHSMPNLAKTSLRSLEAVRSSRSLESDLQGSSSRLTRLQQPTTSTPPSKLRYASSSGQPSMSGRQAVKAGVSTSSHLPSRQPIKSSGYNSSSGIRKMPSSGSNPPSSGAVSRTSNPSPSPKPSAVKSQTSAGYASPKSKMVQPSRRSFHYSKTSNTPDSDDSWKDGCY